jgi:hypothetical protein
VLQTAKTEAGLDHYEVRGYRAWYAHITLAMLAAAYLAATRAQEAKKGDNTRGPRLPLPPPRPPTTMTANCRCNNNSIPMRGCAPRWPAQR